MLTPYLTVPTQNLCVNCKTQPEKKEVYIYVLIILYIVKNEAGSRVIIN